MLLTAVAFLVVWGAAKIFKIENALKWAIIASVGVWVIYAVVLMVIGYMLGRGAH